MYLMLKPKRSPFRYIFIDADDVEFWVLERELEVAGDGVGLDVVVEEVGGLAAGSSGAW